MKGGPVEGVQWSSWHLHLGSQAQSLLDRVLLDVIRPTIAELDGKPWFFIRYWQGGPHLRLRVGDLHPGSGDQVERSLQDRLAIAGNLTGDEKPVSEAEYRAAADRLAASETGADRQVARLLAPGVHRAVYEPEFARYGGPELMPLTERLFQLSSELVLGLLPHLSTTPRAAVALRATISAAAALGGETEQAAFYAHGLAAWRSWAADIGYPADQLDRLCAVGPELRAKGIDVTQHGPFARWHAAIADLVTALGLTPSLPPGQIVSSHVHMFHNRLGRNLLEELRTYACLASIFPRAAVVSAHQSAAPQPAE